MSDINSMNVNPFEFIRDCNNKQKLQKLYNYHTSSDRSNGEAKDSFLWLGCFFHHGKIVKEDGCMAFVMYTNAALLDNHEAMNILGMLYHSGIGVGRDYQKAMKYFEKATILGNSRAANNLGFMYENGNGVEKSHETVKELYQKSLELNSNNKFARENLIRILKIK
jgi:TPR repeat protein